jgi:excinuclease ABC subunit C
MNLSETLARKLDNLPKTPGCYLFKDSESNVLYVGKAKNLRNRVRSYFHESRRDDPKLQRLVSRIADVEVIQTDSETEALILESNLVKQHRPRYNIELKDDKSYPYIKITDELFPRIYVTREKEKAGGDFFGPYTDVKNLRQTLKTLHRIFPIRSCTHRFTEELIASRKVKLCLDYHIRKCEGPCQGLVAAAAYAEMISQVRRFLSGKTTGLIKSLRESMFRLADEMKFEDAAVLRDRIERIESYTASQKIVFQDLSDRDVAVVATEDDEACGVVFRIRDGKMIGRQHFYFSRVRDKEPADVMETVLKTYYLQADFIPEEIYLSAQPAEEEALIEWLGERREGGVQLIVPKIGDKHKLVQMCVRNAELLLGELKLQRLKAREQFVPHVLESLKRDLNLHKIPRHIECFDNSNIQGSDPVSSMVVFADGKPKKSEYRKYHVRTVQGPDDFATMHEVVTRRYLRVLEESIDFPDLIVIDGGKGQLHAAVEALESIGIQVSKSGSEGQAVIGLAKRLEEIFIPGVHDAIMIPKTSSALKLLQHVRDEAHRFAVTFHRQTREKRTLTSELDAIEGIGNKRKQALLTHFGSVRNIAVATRDQLAAVEGISPQLADRIAEYFENSTPPAAE